MMPGFNSPENHWTIFHIVSLALQAFLILSVALFPNGITGKPEKSEYLRERLNKAGGDYMNEVRRLNEYVHIDKTCESCGRHHLLLPMDSYIKDAFYFRCSDACSNTIMVTYTEPTVIIKKDRKVS